MKKMISCIAVAAVLTAFTACGAKNEKPVPAAEVTTSAASETVSETTTVSQPAETTAVSSETSAASTEDTALIPDDFLFGGYVSLEEGTLKMYSKPDKSADVVAEIPYATQIEIYSCGADGWYKTGFDGKTGFVESAYINEIEPYIDDMDESVPGIVDHEEIAVSKMNDLNLIIRLTNVMDMEGIPDNFVKVDDERIRSLDDLKKFITETCSGETSENFIETIDMFADCYKDEEDGLYYNPAPRGFPVLITGGGVTISDPAMNYFTATTNQGDEMNSPARAVFFFDGKNWTIKHFEFGDFIKVCVKDETAYVRTDADDNADVIEELTAGTILEVNTYDSEWYSVSYPEQYGYIRRSAVEYADESHGADDFLGMWYCGRLWAQIDKTDDSGCHVYIKWSWSAADGVVYEYDCVFDEATSTLRCYDSGTCVYYCADDAEATDADPAQYEFENGSAVFEIKDGALLWSEGREASGDPQIFER